MSNRKLPKSSLFTKKKYSFKIAGCQHQIKRTIVSVKGDDEWLKKFFYNN